MSEALEGLKQLGLQIHDAVDASNKVLDDALDKVDKTSDQLTAVNDRMKETLKKVRVLEVMKPFWFGNCDHSMCEKDWRRKRGT